VGDDYQRYRTQEGSQVINDVHLIDVGVTYAINKRFGLSLSIPYQKATRSSPLRDPRTIQNGGVDAHGNTYNYPVNPSGYSDPEGRMTSKVIGRSKVEANGLGDIKLLATAWILDPEEHEKFNISGGLGVLFPTGQKDVIDVATTVSAQGGTNVVFGEQAQYVDNSIQPGAGAWGIIFDLYTFYQMKENLTLFASGTYIATPETTAGVRRGALNSTRIWSVGDAYVAKIGAGYTVWPSAGLTATLAMRLEGTPTRDLIGSSKGERRPGYAVAVEPGLVWAKDGWVVSFSTPVAVYRNRTTTFGAGDPGDAAFADFITMLGVSKRF
jgi:hypothetical protein